MEVEGGGAVGGGGQEGAVGGISDNDDHYHSATDNLTELLGSSSDENVGPDPSQGSQGLQYMCFHNLLLCRPNTLHVGYSFIV